MASKGKDRGTRKKIEEQMEKAEELHKKQLFRHRIELAKAGVDFFEKGQFAQAAQSLHTYIRILEDWKNVAPGGLSPSLFDQKADLPEILLISGVYWDLAKLYDRTKSDGSRREMMQYMEKFILFSRGMPFQGVSAETLRKYIASRKPVHKVDFKNAYKMLADTKCFVATSLVDVIGEETLPRLRAFRDERLMDSVAGRVFVRGYYFVGPGLARAVDRMPEFVRRGVARVLDHVAGWVG